MVQESTTMELQHASNRNVYQMEVKVITFDLLLMDKDRDLVEEVFRSNMGSSRESVLECLELGVSLTIEDFQEGSEVFSLDLEFRVVTDMASGFGTIALALVATPRLIRRCRCGGDPSDFTESEITTRLDVKSSLEKREEKAYRTLLSFVAFVIKDFLRTKPG